MDLRDIGRVRDALRRGGVLLLGAYAARRFADALLIRGATRRLRAAPRDVEDALDLVYDFRFGDLTIVPIQVRSELRELLRTLEQAPPKAVLEIGTAFGGTLFLLTRVASPDATLVSVDLPMADLSDEGSPRFGGGNYAPRKRLYESFARDRQRVVFLPADSHSPHTLARIREELAGQELDFLLIDGDHSAEGVRMDFEMYAPLVRDGGLVAFHDIVDGPEESVGGVPGFWRSLQHLDTVELVEDRGQGGYGIGIVRHRLSGAAAPTASADGSSEQAGS